MFLTVSSCEPEEGCVMQFVFSRTIRIMCCLHTSYILVNSAISLPLADSQVLSSLTLCTQLPANAAHPLTDIIFFDDLSAAVGVEDYCFPASNCIMYADLQKP